MGESATTEKKAHSGATGWEALMPLDWNRLRQLTNEPVPNHLKKWWFSLGGTPAYLFFIQITTGILLSFYYQPGTDAAYESMQRITYEVPFGWYIRSIHMWSANLMIITVILHMLRVFFTRAFRHPRQFNWVFGVALLLLTLTFGFTGYSLVYEQLSFWGATVASNLTETVPLIGPAMATFIRGGPEVGEATMTRLFLLHIMILPAVLVGTLGLHLTFVRLHGVTEDEFEVGPKRGSKIGEALPGILGSVTAIAAVFAAYLALSGGRFEFIGYEFLGGASRLLFALIAVALAAGAWGIFRRHLAGLMVFLTFAILGGGKLIRDLMIGEAPDPGLWTILTMVTIALLFFALIFHRRFTEQQPTDDAKHFNFFPDHALTELMIGTGILTLLTLMALIFPAELGEKANPLVTPDHIKPEWYFYFQFRILKLTSLGTSVALTGVLLILLFGWPWIDRLIEKILPGYDLSVYLGVIAFWVFLRFTVWEAMVP